jgi:hypothetical protein
MEEPSIQSAEALFAEYLEICNQALESNADNFPYKQLWEAAQQKLKEKAVAVAIYDDHPKAAYEIKFADNTIDFHPVKRVPQQESWHVNLSYLEEVVAHKDEYIQNPAKIDWDWLSTNG